MTESKPVAVKVTIDEPTAQGHYVNFANILQHPYRVRPRLRPRRPGPSRRQDRQPDPDGNAVPRQAAAARFAREHRAQLSARTARSGPTSPVAPPEAVDTKTN